MLSNCGETFSDSARATYGPWAEDPSVAPTYSATPAPLSCLPALSNSANPIRLVPGFRIDTLGASFGPAGRLLMTSGSVRPAAVGKSSALAVGCGCAGGAALSPLPLEPHPAAATATAASANNMDMEDRVRRGMGSREG